MEAIHKGALQIVGLLRSIVDHLNDSLDVKDYDETITHLKKSKVPNEATLSTYELLVKLLKDIDVLFKRITTLNFSSNDYIEHYRSLPKEKYGCNFLSKYDIEIIEMFN